jgi:ATP-dependent Lon protease
MHRQLVKIPLAGVTEAAVLKGTSPIYANSRPGRIIDAIINSKSFSPLILLDEVDKIAQGFRGANPQFALLDILDSDRSEYIDDCLGIPLDLRNVIFIATANDLENISPILLDRFDLIQLPGYGPEEKEAIARGYLMRDLYAYYGIGPEELSLSDEVLAYMVEKLSAREFGVRQLNNSLRQIFEETVYCKEMGRDFRHVWEKEDVDRFFDL